MKNILEMQDTEVSYVGGAETTVKFEAVDIDPDNFDVNPDSKRMWYHRTGIILVVAKYKGKLFFARELYQGAVFCSCHVFVDKDFELEKNSVRQGERPPIQVYRTSPGIRINKGKDAIVDFAKRYLLHETRNQEDLRKYIKGVIEKFASCIDENFTPAQQPASNIQQLNLFA